MVPPRTEYAVNWREEERRRDQLPDGSTTPYGTVVVVEGTKYQRLGLGWEVIRNAKRVHG